MKDKIYQSFSKLYDKGYEAGYKKAKKDFERPRGEWIESKERKGHFYCSECVQQDVSGKWRELFDYKYNFCPNCGSDNRGTEK